MAGPTMPWDAPLEARLRASEMRASRPGAESRGDTVRSAGSGCASGGGGAGRAVRVSHDRRQAANAPAPVHHGAAGGRPAPPPEIDPRSWGSAATGLESRPRPRRQRSNVADDASPQSSAETATGSSTGAPAGAFYRAERSQTVAPEEDDGWFVAQQSALENDLRRLQTNAESGHQQAVRRAKEAEARAEQSRRQMEDVRQRREAKQRLYEAQQAEQEQEQRRQQMEFDVQLKAAAERMMNEAESKLRGGKAPSRVASTRPSPAQPAAAARPSIFESFFGGRKSAAVNTAAGAAGASGASAWAGRAPNPAENADLARRKAEAEARRAREQQKQQRAAPQRAAAAPVAAKGPDLAVWAEHERRMARFEANPPGAIQYAAVPWPPDPALMLRAMVALEGGSEKRVFRKLSMRWHPDKFQSRYGSGLAAADSERILTHVKDISQVLNLAWDAKEF